MSAVSRAHLQLKRIQKEISITQSKLNLMNARLKQSHWVEHEEEEEEEDQTPNYYKKIHDKYPILYNIVENTINNTKKYTNQTIQLSLLINSLCPKLHALLKKELNIPSEYICNKYNDANLDSIPEYYLNFENVGNIINQYKTTNRIKLSSKIEACLSCDALYFKPDVQIKKNNEIIGLQLTEKEKKKLPPNFGKLCLIEPQLFESFMNFYKDHLIRSAFVFQIQPFDNNLQSFIVHIKPTCNGKSNNSIIEILKHIKKIAKNRNIKIRSFAFDGDNAYSTLHNVYYYSYIKRAMKNFNINFETKLCVQQVVSDILHIFKRLRYRVLSCVVHCGFNLHNNYISIKLIKEILKVPSIVFDNSKLTKMNDQLPLELFDPYNFLKLLKEGEFISAAFWFPISLIIIIFSYSNLTFDHQFYLMQCVFWFLVLYKYSEENSVSFQNLKKQKSKYNLDVTFYSEELLIEFTNTVHCNLFLMKILDSFEFNRNSTTPLEHKFGQARVRSKDINTLYKFVKTVANIEYLHCKLNGITDGIPVRRRISNFGQIMSTEEGTSFGGERLSDINKYTPFDAASTILAQAGFESVRQENDAHHVLQHIRNFVAYLINENEDEDTEVRLNNYTKGVSGGIRAQSLITNPGRYTSPWCTENKKSQSKKMKKKIEKEKLLSFFDNYYGRPPELCDLQVLTKYINEHDDECPTVPQSDNIHQ